MAKQLYKVVHEHKHGVDTYLVSRDKEKEVPSIEEVVEAFDIDYEPDRLDESIDIDYAGEIKEL